jgi:predicted N-acyltransferase
VPKESRELRLVPIHFAPRAEVLAMTESPQKTYSFEWFSSISRINQSAWDALAVPLETPFLEWEWLHQLEISGSVTAETGWLPQHLTVWNGRKLVAAAPLYIKWHSAGEFVFDHAWADVANRLGIQYYPKLIGMSPATPVVGYRFLIVSDEEEDALTRLMVHQIDRFCRLNRLSGCSFLFVSPQWRRLMTRLGFTPWLHQSYAWYNRGFETFDDFLSIFNANQRRNIKRERQTMEKRGILFKAHRGDEIPREFFPLMYELYARTNEKYGPWACKYLTREFFEGLYDGYRHRLLFTAAYKKRHLQRPIGMALLVTKGDQLSGRYWGTLKEVNHLHFNTCYYQPVEWAIAHGIRRFDPGAGSQHKLRRGFSAVGNHSLHRFYDERLGKILQIHMPEINRLEQQQIDALNLRLPYKKV